MKSLMKASLILIALSATSVWASTPSADTIGRMIMPAEPIIPVAIPPEDVSEDALAVANMINSRPVQKCISDVEHIYRGDVVLASIQKTSTDYNSFRIKAVALLGGDAVVGAAMISVKRTVGIPWGTHYECIVMAPKTIDEAM